MAALVMTPPGTPGQDVMGNAMSRSGTPSQGAKRTFKDKLLGMVQEAEAAERMSMREAQLQDKKSLSISMLLEGRTQAFVEFFNVTHGNLGGVASTSGQNRSRGGGKGAAAGDDPLPQEALLLMRTRLSKADAAAREGKMEEVYASYQALAGYFSQLGRLEHSEFFMKKALRLAREGAWAAGIVEGYLALGTVYEGLQDIPSAISCHERRLATAIDNSLAEDAEGAYRSLTAVYLRQAEAEEHVGNLAAALASYGRCLGAAERAGDTRVVARANLRMGLLHHEASRWHDAMTHLRRYIEGGGSEALGGDQVSEGVAHTTLARCLREIGDSEGSVGLLESYLEATVQQRGGAGGASQDLRGPAIACCTLGVIHYEKGEYPKAVVSFERLFEISRALGDRGMTDVARFNLGVARGAQRIATFMAVVAEDLPKLLSWKVSRADIFSS